MRNILLLILITSLSSCGLFGIKNTSKPAPSAKRVQEARPAHDAKSQKTRTIGQTAEDLRISAGIHIDLFALDLFKPIDVKVKNGVVYYTGTVRNLKESFAAAGVAWKQNGVKKVVNDLKIEKK